VQIRIQDLIRTRVVDADVRQYWASASTQAEGRGL
jgi:hypothetical protein